MKAILSLSVALVLTVLLVTARLQPVAAASGGERADRAEIAYLETINALGPPQDPQLLFILMGQYANANQRSNFRCSGIFKCTITRPIAARAKTPRAITQ